jgi:hypothetical protein
MLLSTLHYFVLPCILLHRVSSFVLEICFPAPSRQHPWHTALIRGRRAEGCMGPAIPILSRCRCLLRPCRDHPRAVASPRRAFDARCARTSAFIALSTSPRLHATLPQHHPRTSRGAVLRAGGREVNESLRVLVLGSSGMMCMLRVCGCVHPGLVGAGAGVTAGAGEDGDMILVCTARVQEEGPAPWGACWPGPDAPSGVRCEDGGWGLRRR